MATQLGESSQAITDDETRDRDDSPEAGHVREKGLALVRDDFRKRISEGGTMPTNGRHPARQRPEGNLSRDISRAMQNLLKGYIGRGASHARAYIHGDLVVVVMHRTMTKAERTLADEGEEAMVRDMRQVLMGKFREDANRIVGRLTGQRVSAFLSDHDVGEDVGIQAFVLEPAPGRALSQGSVEAPCIAADPGP
jgi:uncharacterized protein YbcI